eukprot:8565719-Pyramimonas_sp.AAC.1
MHLSSEKNWEQPRALHECRARSVAVGSVLFDKRMKVVRAPSESLWAPVASLAILCHGSRDGDHRPS